MKSTGLFGKNSGRVGGVVYSNYRGQQIVRTYQPQVKNPNTARQIAQRAKFKLLSQVASVLSNELKLSFDAGDNRLTSRNAWMQKTFSKIEYSENQASLAIEEIVLTNSRLSVTSLNATNSSVTMLVPREYWTIGRVRARFVLIGYTEGGDLNVIRSLDVSADENQTVNDIISFSAQLSGVSTSFGNVRVIGFAYQPEEGVSVNYEDIEIESEDVTLQDVVRTYSLPNVRFSESLNVLVPRGV